MSINVFSETLKEENISETSFKVILDRLSSFLQKNKNTIAINSTSLLLESLRKSYVATEAFYVDEYTKENIPKDISIAITTYTQFLIDCKNILEVKQDSKITKHSLLRIIKLYNSCEISLKDGEILSIPADILFFKPFVCSSLKRVLNDYNGYSLLTVFFTDDIC